MHANTHCYIHADTLPTPTPPAAAPAFAYVTNMFEGTISKIDTSAQTVSSTFSAGPSPNGVALSNDGSLAYVANDDCTSGALTAIDLSSETIAWTVAVERCARDVVLSPGGTRAYIGSQGDVGAVTVIDVLTRSTLTTVPVGAPMGMAITRDGSRVYGASDAGAWGMSTVTNTVFMSLALGDIPGWVALSPDDAYLYVTLIDDDQVVVIDTAAQSVVRTIPVGCVPTPSYSNCGTFGIALSPDGSTAYVTNFSAGLVRVLRLSDGELLATVEVGSGPQNLEVTPDGALVYVANRQSNTVSVISTASNSVVATISAGAGPWGVAIR